MVRTADSKTAGGEIPDRPRVRCHGTVTGRVAPRANLGRCNIVTVMILARDR